jgi:hypothetical protein
VEWEFGAMATLHSGQTRYASNLMKAFFSYFFFPCFPRDVNRIDRKFKFASLSDFSDLEEKLLWAREHDTEARAIMERARNFMRYFNRREHLDCYLRLLLEEYQNLWRESDVDSVNKTGG